MFYKLCVKKPLVLLLKNNNMKCFNLSCFNFEESAYLKILHFKVFLFHKFFPETLAYFTA